MSKGKSQQVMEHNWLPLEFQLPDGKDALQTAQKSDLSKKWHKLTATFKQALEMASQNTQNTLYAKSEAD